MDKLRIIPEASKHEMLQLFAEGLEDVSFSRPRKDLQWGIPVPGDDSQTMYVWADALTNYLSAIGYGDEDEEHTTFKRFWPADVHIIGKDILRFHAAIWPGMLLSAGLPLPNTIFVHGFIGMAGEKMSKSLGNVIDPFELVKKYGADATRYYLLREIPSTRDGDFTYEKFEMRYRGDLAKGLGNLVARVMGLATEHISESFGCIRPKATEKLIDQQWQAYHSALERFEFDDALKVTWALLKYADKRIDSSRLWEIPKEHPDRFKEIVAELCVLIATVGWMLRPFMPATAQAIFEQLGIDPDSSEEWQFMLTKGPSLFPSAEARDK